ncbi:MAG: hypothetical protein ABIN89_19915 [Chitinophagaceae bacterium]
MKSETFRDKLRNYEVPPPAATWEAISTDLTQNAELLPISKKLFNYEVSPPPYTWNEIRNSLANKIEKTGKSPVLKGRFRHVYKIMAAAAILGLIVTAGLYLNRMNMFKSRLSVTQTKSPNNIEANPQPAETESAPLLDKSEKAEIVSPVADIPWKTRKSNKESNKILRNTKVKNPRFSGNEPGIMIAAKPIRNANGEIIQDTEIINNADDPYISITSPNGQQTKISSKFLHMLLFINDDSDIDEVDGYFDKTFLESLIWKARFQDWRDKIINTSLVPSSTNFMDILEFKNLILMDK